MALEINGGPTYGEFYCTTSEVYFGPRCTSLSEAEELAFHVELTYGIDIRELGYIARLSALDRLRAGELQSEPTHPERACLCGSGLPWLTKSTSLRETRSECARCRPLAREL